MFFIISANIMYPREQSRQSGEGHVMISYQWGHQKIMKRIKECLAQNGIKVKFVLIVLNTKDFKDNFQYVCTILAVFGNEE